MTNIPPCDDNNDVNHSDQIARVASEWVGGGSGTELGHRWFNLKLLLPIFQ